MIKKNWKFPKLPTLNFFNIFFNNFFSTRQIPVLKEKLREKERQLAEVSSNTVMNGTLHQAVAEAKRQYDAIDAALEVSLSLKALITRS